MKNSSPSKAHLKRLYTRKEIKGAVDRLAREIEKDYRTRSIVMIGVLKGAFVFMADLLRMIRRPVTVDFLQVASYGQKKMPGKIRLIKDIEIPIHKRHVILVDDIVDTGKTTRFLLAHLRRRKPASLRFCALLDKHSRREVEAPVHYRGFTVPDIFVVGYGIDYGEEYRHLPEIYGIKNGNER